MPHCKQRDPIRSRCLDDFVPGPFGLRDGVESEEGGADVRDDRGASDEQAIHASSVARLTRVLSLTEIVSFGVLAYAFSVLLLPMENDLGVGRSTLSAVVAVAGLVRAVASPAIGVIIDRSGVRSVMTIGSAVAVALVWAWSSVTSVPQLILVQAGLGIVGAAVFYEPAFAAIARAVEGSAQVRATLAVTVVGGFASTVFLPTTAMLTETLGWRGALRVLAIILLLLTVIPNLLFLRDVKPLQRPVASGPEPGERRAPVRAAKGRKDDGVRDPRGLDLRAVVRRSEFRRLAMMLLAGSLPAGLLIVHLPTLIIERGEDPILASFVAGSIGILSVAGRILLTILMRRIDLLSVLIGVFLLQGLGTTILLGSAGRAGLVGFALAYGLGFGTLSIASPLLVTDLFGRAAFARTVGALNAVVTVGFIGAPYAAGLLREQRGDYRGVLFVAVLSSLAAALAARRLR